MTPDFVIRELSRDDFLRLDEVDLSEQVTLVYRLAEGRLVAEAHDWTRPRWDRARWEHEVAEWRANLRPELWLGAFTEERFAGLASLRYRLAPGLAQLTTLHVDHRFRRRGVASRLLQEVTALARESGATALYVSATPSRSAVGFYLSRGFGLADPPDARMLALEPEDIHMVLSLVP